MFKNILFPTDGSDISSKASAIAVALAHSLGARMTALHVVPPYLPPLPEMGLGFTYAMTEDEYERATKAQAREMLGRVAEEARDSRVDCDTVTVVNAAPWDAIIRTARERGCDAIVMASHGRKGLAGLVLGSETTKVLTHSTIPVLVTR
ncbi:MAG TPA: universal stress protein [Usitatibacter sp.]|nr:universal stress protein [Usitatibacter sp.]